MTNFDELGLDANLVSRVAALGYETPSPIQEEAIPALVSGRDVVGLAQTAADGVGNSDKRRAGLFVGAALLF